MALQEPFKIYTADNNVEAILLVEMLTSAGIEAFADQDQFWALSTVSQLHRSNVWVEKSSAMKAADLIREFESRKQERAHPDASAAHITVRCEECGKTSSFPESLNGTTQECAHCGAYVDVGTLDGDGQADTAEG
ncbi:MAG: DUF2007 domain-containing protein [Planctomycetaceae bacterium]|nr:DUF2007 domain-containing protein [Planctomycetaceae bacterium]